MDGCLPRQNGTARNPRTCWGRNGTGAPLPDRRRQQTPGQMPTTPRMPPAPPHNNKGAEGSQIETVPARYAYFHAPVPNARFSILMCTPKIASTIKISLQMCALMKEHLLVRTLSAVCWCSPHPYCRWAQAIEQTCKSRRALIQRNGIFEFIVIYN